jgi:malate synthase
MSISPTPSSPTPSTAPDTSFGTGRTRSRSIDVLADGDEASRRVLTPEALEFLADLHRRFEPERRRRLEERLDVQRRLDEGWIPDFPEETRAIREATWRVSEPPRDLLKRHVEITGPVERKMIINALNSGADVFMADFEDSNSPTWRNCIDGQVNLIDAVRGEIAYENPATGKRYALNDETATLVVRPRGWHLDEAHVLVDGEPISASLFDFGLYLFHNAHERIARGTGPYFYLPKLENRLEARLWNEVFVFSQARLGLPRGTIRATVLIETVLAAFECDEILHELREHSSGLNCGRWDYIFSFIKKFSARPDRVLPDRWRVTMEEPFLASYAKLVVRTCHRRGAHAIGGMSAYIPVKDDEERNRLALERVAADKRREARDGHDGTWVAHPGLVEIARKEFDAVLHGHAHQIERTRDDVVVTADDLLRPPRGPITEKGLRDNVRIGIAYLSAWLSGTGCVPLEGLMEDAATAEISRAQVWQWLRHRARLDDGRTVDAALVQRIVDEEARRVAGPRSAQARKLFEALALAPRFADFLTLDAYQELLAGGD